MKTTLPAVSLLTSALLASAWIGTATAGHGMAAHKHPAVTAESPIGPAQASTEVAINKPRLGVAILPLSQTELDSLTLEYGVRIGRVLKDSPAAAAGVQSGDIVTEIGGRPAYSPERLLHLVAEASSKTTIGLTRDGEKLTLPLKFAADGRAELGIRIQNMTADLKEAFGTQGERGVLVAQVRDDSAAGQGGLKAGDIIVELGGKDIAKVSDIHRVLAEQSPGEQVKIVIVRDRTPLDLTVELGTAAPMQPLAQQPPHQGMWPDKHGYGHPHGHGCSWKDKMQRKS